MIEIAICDDCQHAGAILAGMKRDKTPWVSVDDPPMDDRVVLCFRPGYENPWQLARYRAQNQTWSTPDRTMHLYAIRWWRLLDELPPNEAGDLEYAGKEKL